QHVAELRGLDCSLSEPDGLRDVAAVRSEPRPGGETQDGLAFEVGWHGDVAAVVEAALGVAPAALVAIQEGELVGQLHRPRVGLVLSEVAIRLPLRRQLLLGAGTVAEELPRLYWVDPPWKHLVDVPGVGAGFLEATGHREETGQTLLGRLQKASRDVRQREELLAAVDRVGDRR